MEGKDIYSGYLVSTLMLPASLHQRLMLQHTFIFSKPGETGTDSVRAVRGVKGVKGVRGVRCRSVRGVRAVRG